MVHLFQVQVHVEASDHYIMYSTIIKIKCFLALFIFLSFFVCNARSLLNTFVHAKKNSRKFKVK